MFYTLENVKERITSLSVGDWIELQKWLKKQPIDDAKNYVGGLALDVQSHTMREAAALSQRIAINTGEGYQILAGPAGVAKLLHLTLLKTEPKLTYDEVCQRLEFKDLAPILNHIMEVNGFWEEKKEAKNEDQPAP